MVDEKDISKLLFSNNLTISIAESCTGGLISNKLTDIPGSSKYFKMGIVAYSNEAKIKLLGVKPKIIQDFGAVSSNTAIDMALGIKKFSNSDIGIGVTGIAGPEGGSKEKPVGLIFIAIVSNNIDVIFKKYLFEGNRKEIKEKISEATFDLIHKILLKF